MLGPMSIRSVFFMSIAMVMTAVPAMAGERMPFPQWLEIFRSEAVQEGISQGTVDSALVGLNPIQRVIELDNKQPEGKKTFVQYRQNVVTPDRLRQGRALMRDYAAELDKASRAYGVAPQYIVALWGIETSFGRNTGGFDIIPALATLAWEGRRESFFRKELMDALRILDEGHVSLALMKGSWAGAMGQNQFMPSSFMRFAVDGNGDGRKDIWNDKADVFASTANYLSSSGWRDGERWGREVRAHKVSASLASPDIRKSLAQWSRLGVTLPDGGKLPVVPGIEASLVLPDGAGGPAYLAYHNYRVIMKWNRSNLFAISVGLIADGIAEP